MVDSTQAMESEYVTVDLVKSSKTKILVVVNPGNYEELDKKTKLVVGVNIDAKTKKWIPNRESVENLQVLGVDTVDWVGIKIGLAVEKRNGRESIIARPLATPKSKPKEEKIDSTN